MTDAALKDKPARDSIEEVVCRIMVNDGPDRHTDGSEVITEYIIALLEGRGDAWAADYAAAIGRKGRLPKFSF